MPTSVEAALLDHHIFADDEAMRCHLSQLGKDARDVLVGIDKGKHNRQVASCLNQMGGLNAAAALETRDCVEGHGAGNVFRAQILQHFQVQRTVMPGIALREIHGYLYSHRSCHFTTPARWLRPRRRRPDRARCWPQCLSPSAPRLVSSDADFAPARRYSPSPRARTTPSVSPGKTPRRPAAESSRPASAGECGPPPAPTPPPNQPTHRCWKSASVRTTGALRKIRTAADSSNRGNSRDRIALPDGRIRYRRWRPNPE